MLVLLPLRIGKQWRCEASVVKNWLESQGSANTQGTGNIAAAITHTNSPVGASID